MPAGTTVGVYYRTDGDNISELRILLSGDIVSLLDGKKGPNR